VEALQQIKGDLIRSTVDNRHIALNSWEVRMKSMKALFLAAALLMSGSAAGLLAQTDQFHKYLGVEDIEKVTGLKGIKRVPKSAEADGDLNFAGPDGKVILSASFYSSSAYKDARSSKAGFKSTIQGIGEEAFVGPAGPPPLFILAFRKGNYAVVLNTEVDGQTNARLPMEQIVAIAKVIASRM
jgi:hypothetical protein